MSDVSTIQFDIQTINDTLLDVWANLEIIARLAESVGGGDLTLTGDALNLSMQKNCDTLMAVRSQLDGLCLTVGDLAPVAQID